MSKQFTVGQKVKCIDASQNARGFLKEGEIYTVHEVAAGFVYVSAGAQQRREGWLVSRFEPVAEIPTFKVGDRVRIAKKVTRRSDRLAGIRVSTMDACLGHVGEVTRVYGASCRVRTGREEWNYAAEALELVESAPIAAEPRKLQTGDVVKTARSTVDITAGKEYTVAGSNEFGDVLVKDDAGDPNALLSASEWELVRAAMDVPAREFRIRKHGKTGEVRGTPYASVEDAEKAIKRYLPGAVYEIVEVSVIRTVKVEQEVRVVDYKEAA